MKPGNLNFKGANSSAAQRPAKDEKRCNIKPLIGEALIIT